MERRLARGHVAVKYGRGENEAQCFYGAKAYSLSVLYSYQSTSLYGRLGVREGTIPMQGESTNAIEKSSVPTPASSPPTIEKMDQEKALQAVKEISAKAIKDANLALILGANGKSGRSATGNFSLLAKAIGMTRVHVSRVLKGIVQPSHSTLRKLSEATGISLDEISKFILEQSSNREAA